MTDFPIHNFITHVVNNLFPLLEYAENVIKQYIEKFKQEADDLNITISDNQLRKYIERFDQIKNSPKITDKELRNYTLSQLIKLITSSEGVDSEDNEIENTPDVVYNEGGKTIYNGSKEGNCILYGRGEKWCITRGSYGGYRYSKDRGYPTFYLAKNENLPSSNKLSFVAIQVRDTPQETNRYVYTNRNNSPYESAPMGFSKLMSEIPWLADIPNIKDILKYIPLKTSEKLNQIYKDNPLNIREWLKLEFPSKKQYLVIRKGKEMFDDISNDEFISKYLPKFPQLANFIAVTPGIFNSEELLKNLDSFSSNDRRSVTANLQKPIKLDYLTKDIFSFDVKKLITILKKWDINGDQRMYITKDGSTIVLLNLGEDIKMGLYQADDDYPNIKLNKRTSKYLLEYPELDKIPFQNLIDLVSEGVVDKSVLNAVLEQAKTNPNSSIVVKEIDGKQILIDANSFLSYKIEGDTITRIPFNDEDVQTVFAQEENNKGFQESALNIFKNEEDIPGTIDKEALISIVNATPYNERTFTTENTGNSAVLLTTSGDDAPNFFTINTVGGTRSYLIMKTSYDSSSNSWRFFSRSDKPVNNSEQIQSIINYLRGSGKTLNDESLLNTLKASGYNSPSVDIVKQFVQANPPLSPGNIYRPVIFNDTLLIINTTNPRESLQLSDRSGKLVKASLSSSQAARLIGTTTPAANTPAAQGAGERVATPVAGTGRRGRPAGVRNAPAAPAANVPAGQGESVAGIMANYGLETGFNQLTGRSFTRLDTNTGVGQQITNNRGATRRNNLLGNNGRVVRNISVGPSDIYIIRLANGSNIASVVVQPGNLHYLITSTNAFSLTSPADLLDVLRQRNLTELRGYIMNEYLERNPHHRNEFKELIKKTITEKQNENIRSKTNNQGRN
jgi:hypothetical protein